jgi:hypothetical protein
MVAEGKRRAALGTHPKESLQFRRDGANSHNRFVPCFFELAILSLLSSRHCCRPAGDETGVKSLSAHDFSRSVNAANEVGLPAQRTFGGRPCPVRPTPPGPEVRCSRL